jgi:hypothetical protein
MGPDGPNGDLTDNVYNLSDGNAAQYGMRRAIFGSVSCSF